MEVYDLETDIFFGDLEEKKIDWRAESIENEDPDDEEIETPDDVKAILGFDPKDLFGTSTKGVKFNPYHGPDGRFAPGPGGANVHMAPDTGAEIGGGGGGSGDRYAGKREEARNRGEEESTALLDEITTKQRSKRRLKRSVKRAASAYSEDDNFEVNDILRSGGYISDVQKELGMDYRGLQEFCQQPLPSKQVVYRGVSLGTYARVFPEGLKEGSVIRTRGFASTSLESRAALSFSASKDKGVLMEIVAKRGFSMKESSSIEGESEILQAHNSKYRVVGTESQRRKIGSKEIDITVVKMEEI